MTSNVQHELNQAAYLRLKHTLGVNYPVGRLVVFANGQIVADFQDFPTLFSTLVDLGLPPKDVLVVQIGAEPPEYLDILFETQ
jgi:hypothetical protein